jgi:membrane complex biogenesis BtpA family protein
VTDKFKRLFPSRKPIIAMAHLPPLPGTPLYDDDAGLDRLIESLTRDLGILLVADFDAVMFCNEGDRPYTFTAGYSAVAAMTRVVGELAPRDRIFGVDFLWDPQAALAIAHATGASFIREVVTGVYESDMGLWTPDAAALLRERKRIGASDLAIFANVVPEFASAIGGRDAADMARSAVVSSLADAILVSGPRAGSAPDFSIIERVRAALPDSVPVLANTGCNSENIAQLLQMCDGAIVGSALKVDGDTWGPVDRTRVEHFLKAAGR